MNNQQLIWLFGVGYIARNVCRQEHLERQGVCHLSLPKKNALKEK